MSIKAPSLYRVRPAVASPNYRLRCMASSYPGAAAAGLSQWSSPDVTYSARFTVAGIAADRVEAIFDQACKTWASICGLRPRKVASGGNIIPGAGRIDGGGGTLAYSYMPGDQSPMSDQLQQVYDNSEQWTEKWLQDVVTHELGHAFGLDHTNDPSSIMYPYSNGNNSGLAKWEINQMVSRYGAAAPVTPVPVPDNPPDNPTESVVDLSGVIFGQRYRIRIERGA